MPSSGDRWRGPHHRDRDAGPVRPGRRHPARASWRKSVASNADGRRPVGNSSKATGRWIVRRTGPGELCMTQDKFAIGKTQRLRRRSHEAEQSGPRAAGQAHAPAGVSRGDGLRDAVVRAGGAGQPEVDIVSRSERVSTNVPGASCSERAVSLHDWQLLRSSENSSGVAVVKPRSLASRASRVRVSPRMARYRTDHVVNLVQCVNRIGGSIARQATALFEGPPDDDAHARTADRHRRLLASR